MMNENSGDTHNGAGESSKTVNLVLNKKEVKEDGKPTPTAPESAPLNLSNGNTDPSTKSPVGATSSEQQILNLSTHSENETSSVPKATEEPGITKEEPSPEVLATEKPSISNEITKELLKEDITANGEKQKRQNSTEGTLMIDESPSASPAVVFNPISIDVASSAVSSHTRAGRRAAPKSGPKSAPVENLANSRSKRVRTPKYYDMDDIGAPIIQDEPTKAKVPRGKKLTPQGSTREVLFDKGDPDISSQMARD